MGLDLSEYLARAVKAVSQMSPPVTRLAPLARALLGSIALVLSACPVGFVDPNPPVLSRLEVTWTPAVESLPTVWAPVFDLHLARGLDCAGTRASLAARARAVLLPAGRAGTELPTADASPGCRQAPDRSFDAAALDASIRQAEATYGHERVRPLLLYFNDIDLPLAARVRADFADLRIRANNRGAPPPLVWGLVLMKGRDPSVLNKSLSWTHSADPGLFSELASLAAVELPLRTYAAGPSGGVPLFSAGQTAGVLLYKACGKADPRISTSGFRYDGRAQPIDPVTPPLFFFNPPQSMPLPGSELTIEPVVIRLEMCSANCDRFWRLEDGSLVRWNEQRGCLLPEGDGG